MAGPTSTSCAIPTRVTRAADQPSTTLRSEQGPVRHRFLVAGMAHGSDHRVDGRVALPPAEGNGRSKRRDWTRKNYRAALMARSDAGVAGLAAECPVSSLAEARIKVKISA